MTKRSYLIGVDIGTTSTKAALFTEASLITQHSIEYPLSTPIPGAAEQEPEAIWQAVVTAIKTIIETSKIDTSQLLCLSFSAAMHSLIAIDHKGQPLTKSITWADTRSAKWATQLQQTGKGHEIYRRTGTPIHAMSPLVKLIWLANEHPEIFKQAAKFISIKEFIFYRFFQQYLIDYSLASATGLMNLKNLSWDKETLLVAGITEQHLSKLVPTTYIVEEISPASAAEMGISVNTPIVMGASDGVLANLSVGAITPSSVAVTVGTSGAVRAVVKEPWTDPKERLFCYALTENYWVIGGAVNNGGVVLQWIKNVLGTEVSTRKKFEKDSYDLLINLAQSVAPGAEGLLFHPYLTGERSPIWDANATGSFVGLTLRHTKAHLVRAVLEGIALNLNLVLQALQENIGKPASIQVTGGLAKSPVWRQILADIFAQEITVSAGYESSCLGAAILGLYALQKIQSFEEITHKLSTSSQQIQPIQQNVDTYQKIIRLYAQILASLEPQYASISQLQQELNHLSK